ncbi:MAG: hypothetical protein ACLR3C_06940 [Eggerthella lenta]
MMTNWEKSRGGFDAKARGAWGGSRLVGRSEAPGAEDQDRMLDQPRRVRNGGSEADNG